MSHKPTVVGQCVVPQTHGCVVPQTHTPLYSIRGYGGDFRVLFQNLFQNLLMEKPISKSIERKNRWRWLSLDPLTKQSIRGITEPVIKKKHRRCRTMGNNGNSRNGNGRNGNGRKPSALAALWKERGIFSTTTVNIDVGVASTNSHCPKSSLPAKSHWWVIETPSGPTSLGVCKYCGEVRDFRNRWDADTEYGRRRQRGEVAILLMDFE